MDSFRAPLARASSLVLLSLALGSQAVSGCTGFTEGTPNAAKGGFSGGAGAGESGTPAGGNAGRNDSAGEAGQAGQTQGEGGAPAAGSGGESGDAPLGSSGEGGTRDLGSAGESASFAGEGGSPGDAGAGGEAGACSGEHGCPEPLIVGPSSKAWGVALDQDHVYWTTLDVAGSVLRAPLDGGNIETIASNEPQPFDIAVAAGTVFWCTADALGHIVKAPVTGGTPEPLAAAVANTNGVGRVKSDGTFVYYLANYNLLMKVPVAGGTPVALSLGPTRSNIVDLALFGTDLYWANSGTWNTAYTLKEPGTALLAKAGVSGTPNPSALVTQLDYPQFELAVDGTHVFWSDEAAIYSTSLVGGAFTTVASLSAPPVSATPPSIHVSPILDLISDGAHVYFADAHQVYRVPVTGGTPRVVSWGWTSIQQLAINASAVYFTDSVAGVVKMAK